MIMGYQFHWNTLERNKLFYFLFWDHHMNYFLLFCRKTGYKKKLNSFIQFPDVLDMKDHLKSGCAGEENHA